MKLCYLVITIILALSLSTRALGAEETDEDSRGAECAQALTRSTAAEADVVVSLFLESGNIVVRGWDKREVRARVTQAGQLELRPAGPTGNAKAARRLDVLVANSEDEELTPGESGGSGNVELDVPRGATLNLKLRSGDIEISNVGEARVESVSGDVDMRRVARATEVTCLSGSVYLKDSSGRVRIRSFSGDVEAIDVRIVDDKDDFVVHSTSGNVRLERVAHARVEAATVSGGVDFEGKLARGGSYELRTTSGDVTLVVPADSSFNVNARVLAGGEIINDFSLQTGADMKPKQKFSKGILAGTIGTGEAEVKLLSFNGTVSLRKQ